MLLRVQSVSDCIYLYIPSYQHILIYTKCLVFLKKEEKKEEEKEEKKGKKGGKKVKEQICQTLVLMFCMKNFPFADSRCKTASI